MKKRLLQVFTMLIVGNITLFAQESPINIRTYDGTENNLANPIWGSAGENLRRVTDVGYADGISVPYQRNRPNPRNVSNVLFAQDGLRNDATGLSDYTWVFGQFIDHDIGLTPDGDEPAFIDVPKGDQWFDPLIEGRAIIPMMRNAFDPTTGIDSPRQHPNLITAYIDGSAVYGSDETRAIWLRTLEGGKLKVSEGNLLPYNTFTGEVDSEVDHDAPEMDDPVGLSDKLFVAGDVRANENPLLAALHTLFVREHNRLCDDLILEHPDWSDEQLYQHARRIVGGLIQSIVYNEWLPTMGVSLPAYSGYDPSVHPQLFNVFTAAAFRMGHTLLNGNLLQIDGTAESLTESTMALRDAFFNPSALPEFGMDPFMRGMAVQTQQSMDAKVIDDVRNFLFGVPGAGGLDLASININRGRERGLPDFNTVRKNFGLPEYRIFPQFNSDINVHARLYVLYRSVSWVDPWVGMLAEKPMPNSLFGETINTILREQFVALRDGDRFYFENDPILTEVEKEMIRTTKFRDVIMRNSGIELMQPNVFRATAVSEICPVMEELVLTVSNPNDQPIEGVEGNLSMQDGGNFEGQSSTDGEMVFTNKTSCEMLGFQLNKEDYVNNGVSTADIITIQNHILGIQNLESPYQLIAADVNNSGSVTTLDLINIRNVILLKDKAFPGGKIWTFIPADYTFSNPLNPFSESYPTDQMVFSDYPESRYAFIGVKKGDVNGDAVTSSDFQPIELRNSESLEIEVADQDLIAGNTYEINFVINNLSSIDGYQFGINFVSEAIQIQDIASSSVNLAGLSPQNFGVFQDRGLITTSWSTFEPSQMETGSFNLVFTAAESGKLSEYLSLNSNLTSPEAYRSNETIGLTFEFNATTTSVDQFILYQNEPNPFVAQTKVRFELPEAGNVSLRVIDASGKTVLTKEQFFSGGANTWTITKEELSTTGLLYYEVKTDHGSVTKKMTIID